jgi:hypothetical protein
VPTVLIEDLPNNCQVTVIVSDLYEEEPDPNPSAEMPEGQERENIWLVSKKAES